MTPSPYTTDKPVIDALVVKVATLKDDMADLKSRMERLEKRGKAKKQKTNFPTGRVK